MTPLHHLGELLRQSLAAIPLSVVRVIIVATLSAVLVWVLVLPRAETTPDQSSVRLTENLKLWAAIALVIQIAIYLFV